MMGLLLGILLARPSPDGSATSPHSSIYAPRLFPKGAFWSPTAGAMSLSSPRWRTLRFFFCSPRGCRVCRPNRRLRYSDAMRSLWTLFRTQPLLRESSLIAPSSSPPSVASGPRWPICSAATTALAGRCGRSFGLVGAAGAPRRPNRRQAVGQARHALGTHHRNQSSRLSYVLLWIGERSALPFVLHTPYSSSASLCWTSERRWRRSPTRPASSALCLGAQPAEHRLHDHLLLRCSRRLSSRNRRLGPLAVERRLRTGTGSDLARPASAMPSHHAPHLHSTQTPAAPPPRQRAGSLARIKENRRASTYRFSRSTG